MLNKFLGHSDSSSRSGQSTPKVVWYSLCEGVPRRCPGQPYSATRLVGPLSNC
jgi:hypothetical protein